MLDIFCCNSNNVEDFRQNVRDRIYHFLIQYRFGVNLQSPKKCFQALEDLKKSTLACTDILSCLGGDRITMSGMIILERIHTNRRTPNAVKMAFAGGNAYQTSMRARISHTSPRAEAYQGDTFSEGLREGIKDLHSWI